MKIPLSAMVMVSGEICLPQKTMQTLRLVRKKYPDIMLCLATNGLGIGHYINELAELNVDHVTITVNAVDPDIATKIYSWVRYKKKSAASQRRRNYSE